MDADDSVALAPLVKGSDVGEADERLRYPGLGRPARVQFFQQPQGSVAAAGTEDCAYGAVRESLVQLRESPLIVAGQVPMSLKNPVVVLCAIAFGDDSNACLERLAIEGPGRRDDGD